VSYRGGSRFRDPLSNTPGPGTYTSNDGKINLSPERVRGGKFGIDRKDGNGLRSSLGKSQAAHTLDNPGPGYYKILRDFGNY